MTEKKIMKELLKYKPKLYEKTASISSSINIFIYVVEFINFNFYIFQQIFIVTADQQDMMFFLWAI